MTRDFAEWTPRNVALYALIIEARDFAKPIDLMVIREASTTPTVDHPFPIGENESAAWFERRVGLRKRLDPAGQWFERRETINARVSIVRPKAKHWALNAIGMGLWPGDDLCEVIAIDAYLLRHEKSAWASCSTARNKVRTTGGTFQRTDTETGPLPQAQRFPSVFVPGAPVELATLDYHEGGRQTIRGCDIKDLHRLQQLVKSKVSMDGTVLALALEDALGAAPELRESPPQDSELSPRERHRLLLTIATLKDRIEALYSNGFKPGEGFSQDSLAGELAILASARGLPLGIGSLKATFAEANLLRAAPVKRAASARKKTR